MKRILKVACIFFVVGAIILLVSSIQKSYENKEYYKHNLMKYLVSANNIVTIIVQTDEDDADYGKLYSSLFNRLDRIERFISTSNRYIGFDYSTSIFSYIEGEMYNHPEDNMISDEEMEYVMYLNTEMSNLIADIRSLEIEEKEDYEVNSDLSIDEINGFIKRFEYEFE